MWLNMVCGPSEITTEYLPLQYVPLWPNIAWGPSEVTTEYVPLQYVSWLVWGYIRIRPAAICLVDPMMTPWTLKIHENESRTPYFTPLNHSKDIWKQSVRNMFRPFLTNFDPMTTPQTPKIHENESRTPYFTPLNQLKLIWKKLLRKKFRPFWPFLDLRPLNRP